MTLKELKDKLTDIQIKYADSFDYQEEYADIWNTVTDYENDEQDLTLTDIIDNYGFVDYEEAEQRAKYEINDGGLLRLRYFLNDVDFYGEDLFIINDYGNLENCNRDTFRWLLGDLLEAVDDKLKEGDSYDC